jgi:hydroxymethylbilane synthase
LQSSPTPPALTLGTRGSPLALAQAEEVRRRLSAAHGIGIDEIAIEVIKTTGDIILDRPLSEVGGKGLFTKEIEQALYDGRIDLAVHSAKDVATQTPDAFELSAFLPREDVRDVFLSLIGKSPDHLPEGAKIGTSSLRRGAQMKRFRPDFRIVQFRGNVQTRLQKLADGVADATLLALAGLNRLEQAHRATLVLDPRQYPPAPAQGAICLENRKGDTKIAEMAKALDDPMTMSPLAQSAPSWRLWTVHAEPLLPHIRRLRVENSPFWARSCLPMVLKRSKTKFPAPLTMPRRSAAALARNFSPMPARPSWTDCAEDRPCARCFW